MARRDDEPKLVEDLVDDHQLIALGVIHRQRHDSEVQLARDHALSHRAAPGFADRKSQPGVFVAHGVDRAGEEVAGGRRAGPHADRSGLEPHERAHGFAGLVRRSQSNLCVLDEYAPGLGELDPVPGAMEKLDAHLGFDFAQGSGERGLGDTEFLGGSGHVPVRRDRDHLGHRAEFHGVLLAYS